MKVNQRTVATKLILRVSSPGEKAWKESIVAILSCLDHTELHFQGGVRCVHFRYTTSRIPVHACWLNTNEKEKAAA